MRPELYQERVNKDYTNFTKIVRIAGKRYRLPKILYFDDDRQVLRFNARYYQVTDFRCPEKGEWFLSGSTCTAYLASNDLSTPYLIAVPTHKVILVESKSYKRGNPV